MIATPHVRPGPALALVLALVLVAVSPVPAGALHQNCGTKYPDESLSNGHPNLATSGQEGWAGQTVLNGIESGLFTASSVKSTLMDVNGVIGASAAILTGQRTNSWTLPDGSEVFHVTAITAAETALRAVQFGLVIGATAALVAETALLATQRSVAGAVGGENACNDVLGGDMLDHIWVSIIERNLASDGPPLALLLIPTDTEEAGGDSGEWPLQSQHEPEDFAWCPKISLPAELPTPAGETDLTKPNGSATGGNCTPAVHDGFLTEPYADAPRVTVQAVVRDAIDHAAAHGLPTRSAETHFQDALADVQDGRFKEAFQHFRLAYQDAAGFDG